MKRNIIGINAIGSVVTDNIYADRVSAVSLGSSHADWTSAYPIVILLYSLNYPDYSYSYLSIFGDLLGSYFAAKVRLRLALSSPSLR
jgi:hypothetical protein